MEHEEYKVQWEREEQEVKPVHVDEQGSQELVV